jgi:hypothetical protein
MTNVNGKDRTSLGYIKGQKVITPLQLTFLFVLCKLKRQIYWVCVRIYSAVAKHFII